MDAEDRRALANVIGGAITIAVAVVAVPFLVLGLGALIGVAYRGFMLTCGC